MMLTRGEGEDTLLATSVSVKGKGVMNTYVYHPSTVEAPSQPCPQLHGTAAEAVQGPSMDPTPDPGPVSVLAPGQSSVRVHPWAACGQGGGSSSAAPQLQGLVGRPGEVGRNGLRNMLVAPGGCSRLGIQQIVGRIASVTQSVRSTRHARPSRPITKQPAAAELELQALKDGWLLLSEMVYESCPEEILMANQTC